jgi:spermidine/putrescine transport system ATP-binding protein
MAEHRPGELIRIERVVKRYGNVAALDGVSLEIGQGEFLALLGPSGCGKTTLLRVIAGFIEPTEGEVWIEGRHMNGVPPNRRPVNTVFQNYALFPHLTVAENVAFGPRRRGAAASEIGPLIQQALALVGMEGFAGRYPAELSGGQQQRVALARAVVNRPRVLLLDEPLGALDLKLRKRMQLELKRLQEKLGITFVFVTHDQEEALVMADRIAVMNEGRLVQVGTGEAIYRDPKSRFVASFIGEANLLKANAVNGHLRLEATGTALPYSSDAADSPRLVMVRPEDIQLGAGAPAEDCVNLEVVVRERIFLGNTVRVHAALGKDEEIVLQPASIGASEQVRPGDRITIHWHRYRARTLDV